MRYNKLYVEQTTQNNFVAENIFHSSVLHKEHNY